MPSGPHKLYNRNVSPRNWGPFPLAAVPLGVGFLGSCSAHKSCGCTVASKYSVSATCAQAVASVALTIETYAHGQTEWLDGPPSSSVTQGCVRSKAHVELRLQELPRVAC